MDMAPISVYAMGDKTCWQAVPLIKGHAGAQRVGSCGTLLALLRLHVEELPFLAGEIYKRTTTIGNEHTLERCHGDVEDM